MTRRRDQQGFTLMELLIVIAVSGVIATPLFAWMFLGLRTEAANSVRSAEATSSNQLAHYLPLDLAASTEVEAPGAGDCTGGTRSGGTLVLATRRDTAAATALNVYSVVVATDGTGTLVRRTCDGVGGVVASETPVARDLVAPAGGWASMATCSARPGIAVDPCGQVTVRLEFASGRVAEARAARRIAGAR